MSKGISFKIKTNNIDKYIKSKDEAIARAFDIIGGKAEGYVKALTPVDTGRLRGSITYKTKRKGSSPESPATSGDGVQGRVKDAEVIIGTNVEYAPYIEFGAQGRTPVHMVKRGVGDHMKEYEKILKSKLESDVK